MKQISLQPSFLGSRVRPQTSIGAAFLVLILATACDSSAPPPPTAPVVEVVTVAQRDVPIYMEWIGSLDGNVNAIIRPQVTGYLIKQNYREGDLVKQGQPLFEIDPRTFEASVQEAKGVLAQNQARRETTSANLARIKPLAAKNAVSQKDLDDAVGSDMAAKAAVPRARRATRSREGVAEASCGSPQRPPFGSTVRCARTVSRASVTTHSSTVAREAPVAARAAASSSAQTQS